MANGQPNTKHHKRQVRIRPVTIPHRTHRPHEQGDQPHHQSRCQPSCLHQAYPCHQEPAWHGRHQWHRGLPAAAGTSSWPLSHTSCRSLRYQAGMVMSLLIVHLFISSPHGSLFVVHFITPWKSFRSFISSPHGSLLLFISSPHGSLFVRSFHRPMEVFCC